MAAPTIQLQGIAEAPQGRMPWLWLWDLELSPRTLTLPPVVFRMTNAVGPVQWPPRASVTASMTVTVLAAPNRARFTATAGTFTYYSANNLVDTAGSAAGNNRTQAVVYAVAVDGAWIEVSGTGFASETRSLTITLGPTPVTFYPFPFSMGEIEADQEGNLPSIDLQVDNTSRVLMSTLHDAGGFEGNRASLVLTHASAIASPPYPNEQALAFRFRIAQAVASNSAIALKLESPQFFTQGIPRDRFVSKRCRWLFGSRECGYPITPFAAFTTCEKTIAACIARGDDEVARLLPRQHPKRFGGFPGIPQSRAPR
jgi:phage-related protein